MDPLCINLNTDRVTGFDIGLVEYQMTGFATVKHFRLPDAKKWYALCCRLIYLWTFFRLITTGTLQF